MFHCFDYEVPGYGKGRLLQVEPDLAEAIKSLRYIYGPDVELHVEAVNVQSMSNQTNRTRSRKSPGRRTDTVRGVEPRDGLSPSDFDVERW